MTAEIAIMNKEAVALATDSAVTTVQERGQKIFTSANKLFTLSKYCPVGIMIYGNANLLDVPWETIIKIYRRKLGSNNFNTLKEYADNFISFLDGNNMLFTDKQQEEYLFRSTLSYFAFLRKDIGKKVESIINDQKKILEDQVKIIITNVIQDHFDKIEKQEKLPSIPEDHTKTIINKYEPIIKKAIETIFEQLPISTENMNLLVDIGAKLFSKIIFPSDISGIVIAGFGEGDIFPHLKSFDIDGLINNKLKYVEKISGDVTVQNRATIIPFAQREMVNTFMEGTDPSLQTFIQGYLTEIFEKYPDIIIGNIEKLNDDEKKTLKEKLKKESKNILNNMEKDLSKIKRQNYIAPIIDVVAMLPKDELAAMAESLVNLTLFKRRVSMDAETVAGPIDVALISKGDGFIWIKRKHYFEQELNPQFFNNYYREVSDEKKQQ